MDCISTHSLTKRLTERKTSHLTRSTFQLTASRRGWLSLAVSKVWFIHFNSQPHEEADENSSWENLLNNISTHSLTKRLTANCYRDKSDWEISTHSLTKRLTLRGSNLLWHRIYFNSQPHEEADKCLRYVLPTRIHFNSQPHEEADIFYIMEFCNKDISTHSLTKRLTRKHCSVCLSTFISTHSLTKRLTTLLMHNKRNYIYFNSQPHEEADLFLGNQTRIRLDISTHSLTKRLTAILDKNTFI